MGLESAPSFVRCRTCGKYISKSDAYLSQYCSEECAIQYAQCLNCGRYFRRPATNTVAHCSSECAAVYEVPINPAIRNLWKEVS